MSLLNSEIVELNVYLLLGYIVRLRPVSAPRWPFEIEDILVLPTSTYRYSKAR